MTKAEAVTFAAELNAREPVNVIKWRAQRHGFNLWKVVEKRLTHKQQARLDSAV